MTPAWAAHLFWAQDRPVGLALVRALDQPVRVLNAFFTVLGARRAGIGSRTVCEVLLRHPGSWEVPFLPHADHGLQRTDDWRQSLLEQMPVFDRVSQLASQVLSTTRQGALKPSLHRERAHPDTQSVTH